MNLSAPTNIVFIISAVIAVIALAVQYAGVSIPVISGQTFEALAIAYILLALGNLLKGM